MFLSSLANDNNNDILCLPLAVFIALMLVGQSKSLRQIFQMKLTVQATGIANLHMYFMHGNLPYCMQIPREKHVRNTRVENTRKLGKFGCKILCTDSYNNYLHLFGLLEFLHYRVSAS